MDKKKKKKTPKTLGDIEHLNEVVSRVENEELFSLQILWIFGGQIYLAF